MANQYKNKVIYGNQTLMDITDTTADAADVIEGEVFYTKSGARSVGTLGDATQSTHGLMSVADKVKLDSINDDMYVTVDTPAAVQSFSDGTDNLPMALQIAVEPVQDLHGYDHPWPAGSGKNKINAPDATLTYVKVQNGAVTVTSQPSSDTSFKIGEVALKANNTYVCSGAYNSNFRYYLNVDGTSYGPNNSQISDTFTPSVDQTVNVNCVLTTSTPVGRIMYPMIRLSSITDATWEPYSNVCPISGWTGVNVTRTGKNLLNPSTLHRNNPSTGQVDPQWVWWDQKISCKQGDTFKLNCHLSETVFIFAATIAVYNRSGRLLENLGAQYINLNNMQFTVTSPEACYLMLKFYHGSSLANYDFSKAQLELGSTATAYEPYAGEQYSISFPSEAGTVYGGTLTIKQDGSGTLVVDKICKIYNSSDGWGDATSAVSNGFYSSTLSAEEAVEAYSGDTVKFVGAFSNMYKVYKQNLGQAYTHTDAVTMYTHSNHNGVIWVRDSNINTLTELNTLFASTPLQVCYPLRNIRQYSLTFKQVKTLLGLNNIWADTGNINYIEYYADASGLLSSYDKAKLDTLATVSLTGNYTDLLNKPDLNSIYSAATTSADGLMSAADKVKVNHSITESDTIVDKEPYIFRQTSNGLDNGNRSVEKLIGGTVAWNQVAKELNSTNWNPESNVTATYNNGVANIASTVSKNGIRCFYAWKNEHKYIISANVKSSNNITVRIGSGNDSSTLGYAITSNEWAFVCGIFNNTATNNMIFIYASGVYSDLNIKNIMVFDLTQMFGSAIADAIYIMEQATAGSGVAWFRNLFPKAYYAYNAGELMSVQAASKATTGFNLWDEEWEIGSLDSNGLPIAAYQIRSKNFIKVIPNGSYYAKSDNNRLYLVGYDSEKLNGAFFSPTAYIVDGIFTIPSNVCYIKFVMSSSYGTTYNNNICINISDSAKNGTYEPYSSHTYPFDPDLILRGIPKWENGKMYYDGDEYTANGTVTRKYGIVDLGTLTWQRYDRGLFTATDTINGMSSTFNSSEIPPFVCAKYLPDTPNNAYSVINDKRISRGNSSANIWAIDSAYSDAATFKAAMSGVYLIYKLATPTTESADPFANGMLCDPNGTEEFIDAGVTASTPTRDVAIPIGHETTYGGNPYIKTINNYYTPDLNGNINISYNTLLDKPDLSSIQSVATTSVNGLMSATDKTILDNLESKIGIIVDGNKSTLGASASQYIILKNSTISGCADGLYKATKTIPANTAIDSTYLSAVNNGGLNALRSEFTTTATSGMAGSGGFQAYEMKCRKMGHLVIVGGYFFTTSALTATKDTTNIARVPYKPTAQIDGLMIYDASYLLQGLKCSAYINTDGYMKLSQPSSYTFDGYYTFAAPLIYYTND